jgi:hypothetical protein
VWPSIWRTVPNKIPYFSFILHRVICVIWRSSQITIITGYSVWDTCIGMLTTVDVWQCLTVGLYATQSHLSPQTETTPDLHSSGADIFTWLMKTTKQPSNWYRSQGRHSEEKHPEGYPLSRDVRHTALHIGRPYSVVILSAVSLVIKSYPRHRPWRPIRLWDAKDSILSTQSANRWWQGCQLYAPAALYSPETLLFLCFWYSFLLEVERTPGSNHIMLKW